MILTEDQIEILKVIQRTKTKLKMNALINESLDRAPATLEEAINLNNLYAIFVNSFEEI